LSAALAPEKLELIVPEKKTNFLQVLADLDSFEFVQIFHRTPDMGSNSHNQETRVKVLTR
jgi:hypothetical protein